MLCRGANNSKKSEKDLNLLRLFLIFFFVICEIFFKIFAGFLGFFFNFFFKIFLRILRCLGFFFKNLRFFSQIFKICLKNVTMIFSSYMPFVLCDFLRPYCYVRSMFSSKRLFFYLWCIFLYRSRCLDPTLTTCMTDNAVFLTYSWQISTRKVWVWGYFPQNRLV